MSGDDISFSDTLTDEEAEPQGRAETLDDGETLGRFVLEHTLGSGGMGTVYAAHDPKLNRRVAIKVLRSGQSETARARLLREARAMAKMHHSNVVSIFDAGELDSVVFIAMEYVDGGTFRDWLAKEREETAVVPWERVLKILVQAGRGLAAAHEQNLAHRDFKPENILINKEGEALVADFGLVVSTVGGGTDLQSLSKSTRFSANGNLTQDGAVLGTPSYMAPEQFSGRELDARADQFSFCVVLYEAL